jgi:hypothetical protein
MSDAALQQALIIAAGGFYYTIEHFSMHRLALTMVAPPS